MGKSIKIISVAFVVLAAFSVTGCVERPDGTVEFVGYAHPDDDDFYDPAGNAH